jgi:hypothetical protein
MLNALNTKAVGFAGLGIGAASIIAAVAALFKLLSDPHYLIALAHAIANAHAGTATDDNWYTLAQLAACAIAIFGAAVVALLSAYLGRPAQISDTPKTSPPV